MSGNIHPHIPDPEPGSVDTWQVASHNPGEVAGAKYRKQRLSMTGNLRISRRNGVSFVRFVRRRSGMHVRSKQNNGADEMACIPCTFHRALWLLFTAVVVLLATGLAATTSAVKPLCLLPSVEKSLSCVAGSPSIYDQQRFLQADYPTLIRAQNQLIESLLDGSVGVSAFSWDIRKVQMAVNDLASIARHSELTHRNLISEYLFRLAHGAKNASIGLQRLGLEIQYAVEGIVSVNEHVLATIRDARSSELSSNTLMGFFHWAAKRPSTDDVVLKTFTDCIDHLSATTDRLKNRAQLSIDNIQDWESILATMHLVVARDEPFASMLQEELLGGLRTTLGGEECHMPLLRGAEEYRKGALKLIFSSSYALYKFSSALEVLRQKPVAGWPKISPIPVEIQMDSIRTGLRNLSRLWSNAQEKQVALDTKF